MATVISVYDDDDDNVTDDASINDVGGSQNINSARGQPRLSFRKSQACMDNIVRAPFLRARPKPPMGLLGAHRLSARQSLSHLREDSALLRRRLATHPAPLLIEGLLFLPSGLADKHFLTPPLHGFSRQSDRCGSGLLPRCDCRYDIVRPRKEILGDRSAYHRQQV